MNRGCKLLEKDLVLFGAGTIEDPDLLAHLEECASCRQAVASSRALWHLLGDYESLELGVDLLPRLERQIESSVGKAVPEAFLERLRRVWIPRRLAIARSALACLGLLMGAWTGSMLMTPGSGRSPSVKVETDGYSSIFDASPSGFPRAVDPLEESETTE